VSRFPTLTVQVQPYPDESWQGYVLRTVARQHAGSAGTLLEFFGSDRSDAAGSRFARRLARANGADQAVVGAMLPRRRGTRRRHADWEMDGELFPHPSLSPTWHRLCPQCLHESDHVRKNWHLALYTACARHGRRLLECCPSCGRGFDWLRPSTVLCRCQTRIDVQQAPLADPAEQTLSRPLEASFGEKVQPAAAIPPLSASKWMRLVLFVGMNFRADAGTTASMIRRICIDEARKIAARGEAMLATWPASLREHRDQLASSGGDRRDRIFPAIRRRAFAQLPERDFQFLHRALAGPGRMYERKRFARLERCHLAGYQPDLFERTVT
jgi:hypothetical protein